MSGAAQNTDVEIWRERAGDFYADHIAATKDGGITICVGGTCITKTVQDWHALSKQPINWRDDPDAIVEDDEPQIGRDYA